MGKKFPRGYGDERLVPDGEFSVAILSLDTSTSRSARAPRDAAAAGHSSSGKRGVAQNDSDSEHGQTGLAHQCWHGSPLSRRIH